MSDLAIETDGLSRSFGSIIAVDRVSLKVPRGELYGFLGLNGAGKTTTIRMLTTLMRPNAGTAKLLGHDVVHEPLAVRGLVGLVSDETSESQSDWTAREYLGYFARIRGMTDVRATVEDSLENVGLAESFRGKLIGTYSTGMKRRVEIARAPRQSESAVSRRTDTWPRPAGKARDVEVAQRPCRARERDDVLE